MSETQRRVPKEMTSESFCELAVTTADELCFGAIQACAERFHISTARWLEIKNRKLPDFTRMSQRAVTGYVESIVRVCEVLELDVESCLTACGLPYLARAVNTAKESLAIEFFDEESLQKLLQLVELTGKPVPVS